MKVFRHKGGGAGPQAFSQNYKAGYKTVKNNQGNHLRSIIVHEKRPETADFTSTIQESSLIGQSLASRRPISQQRPYLETLNLMIQRRNLDININTLNTTKQVPAIEPILIQEQRINGLKRKKSDCETVHIPCATDNLPSQASSQVKMRSVMQSIQEFSKLNDNEYMRL